VLACDDRASSFTLRRESFTSACACVEYTGEMNFRFEIPVMVHREGSSKPDAAPAGAQRAEPHDVGVALLDLTDFHLPEAITLSLRVSAVDVEQATRLVRRAFQRLIPHVCAHCFSEDVNVNIFHAYPSASKVSTVCRRCGFAQSEVADS
jgi:hypothetical protein